MNPLNPSPRFASLAAAVTAVTAAVGAVIQLTHEQSGESTTIGAVEHVAASMFSVMMLALIPAVAFLARRATGDVRPAIPVAVAGTALSVLGLSSNIMGEDASFFGFVAAPSLLVMLGSFTVIAVKGSRMGQVPKALAIGLPLMLVASISLSPLGGGLLAAGYWAALAAFAVRGEQRPAVEPVAATA